MSTDRRFCFGTVEILQKDVLKDHYNGISFPFDDLIRAELFFKSIHGESFRKDRLRCMIPNKEQAPMIFIYDYGDNNQLFAIAPIIENESVKQNSRSVSEK